MERSLCDLRPQTASLRRCEQRQGGLELIDPGWTGLVHYRAAMLPATSLMNSAKVIRVRRSFTSVSTVNAGGDIPPRAIC